MEEVSEKIQKIFDQIDEDDYTILAEYIAVDVVINAASSIYEGIGILDVAKKRYEECCLDSGNEDDNKDNCRIINLN